MARAYKSYLVPFLTGDHLPVLRQVTGRDVQFVVLEVPVYNYELAGALKKTVLGQVTISATLQYINLFVPVTDKVQLVLAD